MYRMYGIYKMDGLRLMGWTDWDRINEMGWNGMGWDGMEWDVVEVDGMDGWM